MGIASWAGACSEEGEEVVHLENTVHTLAHFVGGFEANVLTYLSDTIARVIISGLSSTLLVTSTSTTSRSAAVPILFVSRRISTAASRNKLQGWTKLVK